MGDSEFGVRHVESKSTCENPYETSGNYDMCISNLLGKTLRGKESHYVEAKSSSLMSGCS